MVVRNEQPLRETTAQMSSGLAEVQLTDTISHSRHSERTSSKQLVLRASVKGFC
jgi:hypothetical protein